MKEGAMEPGSFHSSINRILEERDRLFPVREPANTTLMRKALVDYAITLEEAQKDRDWKPDGEILQSAMGMAEDAVFICGYMKSGTTLLLELLDGHPELTVMPGDSHMINRIHAERGMTNEERYAKLSEYWIGRLVNPTGQKPFWIMGEDDGPYLDFMSYLDYWRERLSADDLSTFLGAVLAFFCANPRRATRPRFWVEKTPGNEQNVAEILKLVPKARFLHIIRDPRSNIASLMKLASIRKWDYKVENLAYSIRAGIEKGLANEKSFGKDRYLILRYENLVSDAEGCMQQVASFLDISWDKTFLQPTVNGLEAKANSMYSDRQVVGKILTKVSGEWKSELDQKERDCITAILYPVAKRLGYDWDISYAHYFLKRVALTLSVIF